MKYPPHEMLDTYLFITVSTDIVLNVFLNSLHDCHNFYCFIMSLLQWVIQKSKNVLLPPQDTPPDTPQDDHTNYGLEKALCHISKCIHTPISCFSGIFVTVWMFYFTPLTQCQAFVQFSQTAFIDFLFSLWYHELHYFRLSYNKYLPIES